MADDFYGYDEEADEPKGRDNLFLWTVFILLLIGAAFACWLGSFYVFGHPEHPKAYAILKKLNKLTPARRFEVTAAPPGEFLNAQRLFERYSKLNRLELEQENAQLIRNYLKNYTETKKLVTYVTGRYVIMDSYELKKSDFIATGMVAIAQAAEFPQVLIEHLYPSSVKTLPALRASLQTGNPLKLERTNDLAAVVHVEKTAEGRLQFTVMPLLYGNYGGTTAFGLEPPQELNMVPGLPVMKSVQLQESLKKFATYRAQHPMQPGDTESGAVPATTGQEIVRVDTVEPGTPVPETGAMPPVAVATPIPIPGRATPAIVNRGNPTPRVAVAPTPVPTTPRINVAMLTTPIPLPVATPLPANSAITPRPHVSPSGVPLQPFVAAQPDMNLPNAGASWKTYAPGQAPSGSGVSLDEVGPIAERGEVSEGLYLRGEFRVTASGQNRAVLRDATKPDDQSPRVIVEYPAGAVPPSEHDRFVRDNSRPYLIRSVRRGADGVLTIWVKEIIKQ
jgi:hypothetical protein